ncbi:hypothetical protein [Aquabacterium sp. J223]|uniref:hypothetical protein n=1 Tax=Aquabacterium sp. J223 TaxID=2898431 RepID=UPI0021ADAD95|nr:hypothetical protein [Aquabacterium sp. J223]UUX95751.1 hypothetical protein LRS07_21605 [Aquabacterium sp. J223]
MGPIDALLHLLNFLAAPLGVGLISATLVRLLWRRELKSAGWRRLALWSCAGGVAAGVGGLAWFGQDGRMATYGAMVLASALALGWAGWGRR